jgi:DNA-binding response OmpR family regulator
MAAGSLRVLQTERRESMRILIADDEREVVEIMKKFLSRRGFSVDIAFDGKNALESIKANHYDLIFLDENMPELTGLEIVEDVRKNGFAQKIVMITGYPEIREDFAKLIGVDDYIEKPINLQRIEEVVNKYKGGN